MNHVTSEDEAWGGEKGREVTREDPEEQLPWVSFPGAGRRSADVARSKPWISAAIPDLQAQGQVLHGAKASQTREGSPCLCRWAQIPTSPSPWESTQGSKRLLTPTGSLGPGTELSEQSCSPSFTDSPTGTTGTAHIGRTALLRVGSQESPARVPPQFIQHYL